MLGVGQIYACDALGSSLIILAAVLLYSPVQAFHALLGSSFGVLAGKILFHFNIFSELEDFLYYTRVTTDGWKVFIISQKCN